MNSIRHHPSCSENTSVFILLIGVNNLSYLIINCTFFFFHYKKNLVIGLDTNCIFSQSSYFPIIPSGLQARIYRAMFWSLKLTFASFQSLVILITMVLSVWNDRYEQSLLNMKYVCISRAPLTNPTLTSKCSNLLPSEEHIQKLKEAGKDGEKQLIIVSNALLVRFIVFSNSLLLNQQCCVFKSKSPHLYILLLLFLLIHGTETLAKLSFGIFRGSGSRVTYI